MPKRTICKIKDITDTYYTKHDLFDLPLRLLLCGKSQLSGKSTFILNLFRDSFFGKFFKGQNIYYISDNKVDNKLRLLQQFKEIPDENIMPYDEDILTELYDTLEENFMEAVDEKEKPPNVMIVFDDVGHSNSLKNKQAGIVSKLISNGRHINCSQIYSIQNYTMASTTLRNQVTGAILFSMSNKSLDMVEQDFNYTDSRKTFLKMFNDVARSKPHSFLAVSFTRGAGEMYMDSDFKAIDVSKYEAKV